MHARVCGLLICPCQLTFCLSHSIATVKTKKQTKNKLSSAKEIDSITKKNTANDKEEANADEDMDAEEEPDDVHIFRITNPRWEGDPSHSCGKKKKGKPNGCWMVTSFWNSEK